jgi:primosomal protein N' (replication factor Y)
VAAFARVAPPLPVAGLFTYSVPPALKGRIGPGVRVLVPFGSRRLSAMCVGLDDDPPPDGVEPKHVIAVLEPEPLVGPDILELAAWVATGTGCSWGEALDATLPPAVKRSRPARTVEVARLLSDPRLVRQAVDALQEKREKQARALRILADRGGELPVREWMRMAHVSRSPLDSLVKAGLVVYERRRSEKDPFLGRSVERTAPLAMTEEQQAVYERIRGAVARGSHKTFLLHGVTGSGKTEIYLQVLLRVVEAGRQGIVLVPEISLTPQTVRRFRERFPRVAVLHSHLTDAERADQWRMIRRGEADVVVGARSAVFAPVPALGLIVLDEEHETTFKQQNVPRYHAREVAIERARLAGAVTILGTATPSLEAFHRSREGDYERLVLHERVAGGRSPEIVMVDLTAESRRKERFRYLSDPLCAAMEDSLARGGQILLFLNRRGWASVMLCRGCKSPMRCPHCDVSLTLHRRAQRVLCHYCGFERPPPAACPTCTGTLAPLGYGTEKVEEEVRQQFLHASIARMDSDTMSGRGRHEQTLSDFAAGKTQVLIGTQMIAKGLDFPNVTLVGVICADSALFLADYRAAERTFQLLAQVVGRTGRGPKGGRVVVQAFNPRHIAIRTGVTQDYAAFAEAELPLRQEAGYPPFARIVRVIAQARDEGAARRRIESLTQLLRGEGGGAGGRGGARGGGRSTSRGAAHVAASPTGPLDGVAVLGPAPAPIARLNDQYRFNLVAKCASDGAVSALLGRLAGQTAPKGKVRVLVDVDPVGML